MCGVSRQRVQVIAVVVCTCTCLCELMTLRACACGRVIVAGIESSVRGVESTTTRRLPVGDIWPCVWEGLDAGAT